MGWDQLLCLCFGQLTFRKSLRDLTSTLTTLDSTTIDLCLSLFPWAKFRSRKAAIKLHTLMDLEGSIPTFIHISDGRTHDVNVLDMIPIMAGSIYIMDRGYLDFQRLYDLHTSGGRFVIRARKIYSFTAKAPHRLIEAKAFSVISSFD